MQDEEVREASHHNEIEIEPPTPLSKIKNIAITIMALMISMGQWNDTKDVAISAYEEIISRFTNQVEYDRISQLRIGFTREYVHQLLGQPQVIRTSKQHQEVKYYYYNSDKYLLTTFIQSDRLVGFSVLAKKNDFEAPIPYLGLFLNNNVIANYLPSQEIIRTEANNIEYYAETYELSKNLMFYNLVLGRVNYQPSELNHSEQIRAINQRLNTGEEFDLSADTLSSSITTNFYSITELDSDSSFEALLSEYEMNAAFGQITTINGK
ncbi:ETEC_3214 domain-containing protein [Psychromonas sp. MME2]|uniref:ETEC_3214 domain-containing protein n=1 Tax=unclassified Psychromonas TaxID=2614957 RepID=UPI00339C9712